MGLAACGESRAPGDAGDAGAAVPEAGSDAASDGAPPSSDGAPAVDGGDAGVSTRSAGCGAPPPEVALGTYVRQDIVIPGVAAAYAARYTNRVYWIRVPQTYDPDRAYPTVFLGPGCGASGQSPLPLQYASKEDAILIGLNGIDNCFNKDSADTPELGYFDAALAAVESQLCVDKSRVFVAGFSSGSWLTNYLGCVRAGVIRAQASIAGGLPAIPPTCAGPIPAMYVADTDDLKNTVETVKIAVERARTIDGCSAETEPYDFGVPSPCVQYKGCRAGYPVVWCVTSGQGHADNSDTMISTVGFWHFWKSLP